MDQDTVREIGKAHDVLYEALKFHENRDRMNAAIHLAGEVRYSPLTVRIQTAHEGLRNLLKNVD